MKNKKTLLAGIAISSVFMAGFAILLANANIPITVILPTSAPIWVGLITIYLSLKN